MWYPFPYLTSTVDPSYGATFAALTGLGSGEGGCPLPDFPVDIEYLDVTQKFVYDTPLLEKRIITAHTLPRRWTLEYPSLSDVELDQYLLPFFKARKGNWESFYFVDPDKYTFSDRDFGVNPLLLGDTDYVALARFDGNFKPQRYTKNFYKVTINIQELF